MIKIPKTMCQIPVKLAIKNKDTRTTSRRHSGAFIIKFEHISKHCSGIYLFIYLFILYLCLTCIIKNVQYAKNKCDTSPSHKHCEAN